MLKTIIVVFVTFLSLNVNADVNKNFQDWSVLCKVDSLTDKKICSLHNGFGGFFLKINRQGLIYMSVFGNDSLGARQRVKIGSNKDFVAKERFSKSVAKKILSQLKTGVLVQMRFRPRPKGHPDRRRFRIDNNYEKAINFVYHYVGLTKPQNSQPRANK